MVIGIKKLVQSRTSYGQRIPKMRKRVKPKAHLDFFAIFAYSPEAFLFLTRADGLRHAVNPHDTEREMQETPVSSRRPPLSIVKASDAMQAFYEGLRRTRKIVQPIYVGQNMGELETLVTHVLWEQGRSGLIITANASAAKLFSLDQRNLKAIIFPNASAIPLWFQTKVAEHRMSQYLILTIVPTGDTSLPLEDWTPEFANMCGQALCWPHWRDRHEDHEELIDRTFKKLRMPNGRQVPRLHKNAVEYLMAQPFEGSDDMTTGLKKALTNYITQRSEGLLTEEHFIGGKKKPHILNERNIAATAQTAGE